MIDRDVCDVWHQTGCPGLGTDPLSAVQETETKEIVFSRDSVSYC